MNIKDISTQLLYSAIRIYGSGGDKVHVGTGFIYTHRVDEERGVPLLITNYHVVEHMDFGLFDIYTQEGDAPAKGKTVPVSFNVASARANKLGELDLVAIPIAPALENMKATGKQPFYCTLDEHIIPDDKQVNDLAAIEQITFIGYPKGLSDTVNKNAFVRQGITSTPIWNDYKGRPEFLVDASVFPGSSGSPVFIYNQGAYATPDGGITVGNRILFVGAMAKCYREGESEYLDLGVVINSSAIKKEIEVFVKGLLGEA